MSDSSTFRVDFGKPMAIFPLTGVVLMPHSPFLLHVFEPRYRQMVSDVLDGAGQFAMAIFDGTQWQHEYHGRPKLKPIVCVGQIVKHERTDDGRYVVILQGLCRARINEELPATTGRLYRMAYLTPLDTAEPDEDLLAPARARLIDAMSNGRLQDLKDSQDFLRLFQTSDIPNSVLLEVMGNRYLSDQNLRYRLLASEDPMERAQIVTREMLHLERTLDLAQSQRESDAPKGVSWN